MKKIEINTDFIKLNQFLKLIDIAQTGGHAKLLIQDGKIKINNAVCLQRGKKLYKGDIVEIIDYDKYMIV